MIKQLDISVASLFVYPFLHDKHNAIPQVIPTHVWATPTSVEHRGEMGEKATDLGFSGGVKQGWVELSETRFGFMRTLCQFFSSMVHRSTANKSTSFTTIYYYVVNYCCRLYSSNSPRPTYYMYSTTDNTSELKSNLKIS